ncbi:isopentenyl-diphosphate delta-isomerase [Propionicimonas paludicola]|uniref:Isopentenyl-diphosphate Delta-isomerase n=1 Tax=Propionicimonas paludicola TaxID=185243 RepID=A0A2A9CPJ3_9ACTN|nr:isopentenyl-diphosphate Delta-isomerase [Propionicimonas paludicola]PFG15580.1 isopentenyl-diphosphate delta-isomerase [Propionicimonas paludicola]
MSGAEDLVVLLDDAGRPIGHGSREAVHGTDTPLHLAFSCYLLDDAGRVLLTRRALTKRSWPGVWTNSCCGHPRPGEPPAQAVARRVADELGVTVRDLRLVLPEFRYQAVDVSGVVENELCPVWVGRIDGLLRPDPSEVMEADWVEWETVVALAAEAPGLLSPWSAQQVPLVAEQRTEVGVA